MHRALMPILLVAAVLTPAPARAAVPASDEEVLRAARLDTDGPALIAFFRAGALTDERQQELHALLGQLGAASFREREAAAQRLVNLGLAAVPFLNRALDSSDLEVVRRAEWCLEQVHHSGRAIEVPAAAARLIARIRPAGAAAALLQYLPSAGSEYLADEVRAALRAVAVRDGRDDPAVVAALTDPDPIRRAAAAEALCRPGADAQGAVAKLLTDPDPRVRLRAARVLAAAGEAAAVPVLIDLLGTLPRGLAWQAEDILVRLAGADGPSLSLGPDAASQRQAAAGWADWWRQNRERADLSLLATEAPLRGYTMVVLLDQGRILELDPDGKPHWQIDGLAFPLDAQYLPGGRVLVAEHAGGRVTERNLRGEVVWQKAIDSPLVAQRLENGNTFIATRNGLHEVDRDGDEKLTLSAPDGQPIMKAQRLANGDIACVTMAQRFYRLDRTGRERHSFDVELRTSGGRVDVTDDGHVLIPQLAGNKVVEYDRTGKVVWEAAVDQPVAAVRLRNGNTLVTTMNHRRAVELDRDGKEVWEYKAETRVNRAWRR